MFSFQHFNYVLRVLLIAWCPSVPQRASLVQVQALYDFTAEEEDELGFCVGDIIEVLDRSDASWWKGRLRGRSGLFPANYTSPLWETRRSCPSTDRLCCCMCAFEHKHWAVGDSSSLLRRMFIKADCEAVSVVRYCSQTCCHSALCLCRSFFVDIFLYLKKEADTPTGASLILVHV